jgi:hypothetical protein
MANALYDKFVESYLTQAANQVDFDAPDDIRAILVDTADYVVNLTTDEFLTSVTGAGRVATSGDIGVTISGRVVDAGDVTWPTVTGDQSEAVVLYKHTGVEATSRLIAYIDTATGLPATPSGGDITVTWDSGANKIFAL